MLLKRSQKCKLLRSKKGYISTSFQPTLFYFLPHICSAATEDNAAEAFTETPKVCLYITVQNVGHKTEALFTD